MSQAQANQTVKRLSVGVGVLGCLALSACGGGGGGGGGGTNPPPPPSEPTPNPSVEVESTSIDFGQVVLNQRVQRQLQINNTGDVDVDVVPGISDVVFDVTGDCTDLSPGASCDLLVGFSPNMQQTFSADLELDSSVDIPSVTLSGEGVGLNVQITELETDCAVNPVTVSGRVIVTDSLNDPVTGLDASNFTLFLDGNPTDNGIDTFTVETISSENPVSVGVVMDVSGSLAGFREDAAQQIGFFLDDHFDENDTAGIFRFASQIDSGDLARGFIATDEPGREELKNTFNPGNDFDGDFDSTTIWDSGNAALDLVIEEDNPKRAVLLLSDGQDTDSTLTLDELIAKAAEANIAFFTIGFGDIDSQPLEQLANGTGGLFFPAPDSTELNTTFESIASNVTNQYDISFEHPAPQSEAELTVEVFVDPNRGEDSREVPSCP